MAQRMKLGVFGGSFNPPHLGHLNIAVSAANALALDKVLIIPSNIPPHKQPSSFCSGKDRLKMCELGLVPDSRFEVSPIEIERGDKSYTIDTITTLEKLYPNANIYLIIGSDMLEGFTLWYQWEEILKHVYICPAVREKGKTLNFSAFSEEQKSRIITIESEPFPVSSTEIRNRLGAGSRADNLLAPAVSDYIKAHGLYIDRFPKYRKIVEKKLDAYRLTHSFGVARAARELAVRYGEGPDKAELAGLLHDVMKNEPHEVQREMIERGGHTLTEIELANPKVWHAMAGEAYMRLELGITDKDLLSAVALHTTGNANMTLLEKIVYIADFISDDRDYPDVETVRALARESLEKAILYTSEYTVRTLEKEGRPIHPATIDCYNYYSQKG